MTNHPRGPARTDGADNGSTVVSEQDGVSMVSTLVAGPVAWGLIGAGADHLIGTERLFLALGVVVGFVTSLYVTYVRYGRSPVA